MRNNVIVNCNDVGIYLNEAEDCEVHHNTIYDTSGIDVRFGPSVVTLSNNLLTGQIRERDGGTAILAGGNQQNVGNAAFDGWFADPVRYDLALIDPAASFLDQGVSAPGVPRDFCLHARSAATPDPGVVEYDAGPCDTTNLGLMVAPGPGPPAGIGNQLSAWRLPGSEHVVTDWPDGADVAWNVYIDTDRSQPGTTFAGRSGRSNWLHWDVLSDGNLYLYHVRAVNCGGTEAE